MVHNYLKFLGGMDSPCVLILFDKKVFLAHLLHLSVQTLKLTVHIREVWLERASTLHLHHQELPARDDLSQMRQHNLHQLLILTLLHQLKNKRSNDHKLKDKRSHDISWRTKGHVIISWRTKGHVIISRRTKGHVIISRRTKGHMIISWRT